MPKAHSKDVTNSPLTAKSGDRHLLIGQRRSVVATASSGPGYASETQATPGSTTFTSAATLGAVLPAADLAQAGSANLTVVSPAPGGGSSTQVSLAIGTPVPAIVQITPNTVIAGSGPVTLDVKGRGFVATSQISWNGGLLPTMVVCGTELTAVLAASTVSGSSANNLAVVNPGPGGGAIPGLTYNITSPTPVLTSVSPRVLAVAVTATATISGSGFESNSTVLFNGAARPTVFVNAGTLQATLTAADVGTAGQGSLPVSNPGPGSAVSAAAIMPISSEPLPTITGVTISKSPGSSSGCSQLLLGLTGTNFTSGSTVQVNGTTLQSGVFQQDAQNLFDYLPPGFYSKAGNLAVTVTTPGNPALVSDPFALPASAPTVLALCPTPQSATVYRQSSFIGIGLSVVNATGTEQVSVGSLPAGITTSTPQVPLAASSVSLHFQASAAAAPGSYQVTLNTGSGQQADSETLPLTISANATVDRAPQPVVRLVEGHGAWKRIRRGNDCDCGWRPCDGDRG